MLVLTKCLVLGLFLVLFDGARAKSPRACGTLDLTSRHTQHCFPEDGAAYVHNNSAPHPRRVLTVSGLVRVSGSHHFVCCVDISTPGSSQSPHGNGNPLNDVIKAASKPSSYSWCTCSEEICTQQLGGQVAWNQNGAGWKGFLPPQ